ncbi:MAG: hypothetical protein ISS19_11660, partial [Bacteroidales bacterium]|nr:hypothetical protein [Bacteroidales bacterium]
MNNSSLPGSKKRGKIRNFFRQIIAGVVRIFKRFVIAITPDPEAWKGAMIGLAGVVVVLLFVIGMLMIKHLGILIVSGFIIQYLAMGAAAAVGLFIAIFIFQKIPGIYRWVLVGAVFILLEIWWATTAGLLAISGITVLSASLAGGVIWIFIKTGWKHKSLLNKILNIVVSIIGVGGIVSGSYWLLMRGVDVDPPVNAALKTERVPDHITMPDPSIEGDYAVLELTYGSGEDKHREEFGKGVTIITDSVDGSRFVSGWDKFNGWARTRYWGFDEEALPRNARVWYPGGKGPFPLVLIVHGNHLDRDYSDPGYDYLGKLMASRGFIFASVDENFLNAAWSNMFKQLDEENDCRGWLLLKHLELWREWNEDEKNPFYNKVDLSKIGLIGHSRGGEAVAIAAAFNQLPYYPDDATIEFDFGFDIKSVIAIAPVDGQYKPGSVGTFFGNVNYFVLQGSHDMDMRSYNGARQWQRIKFSDTTFHVKAGMYIWAANHGQFNSAWGENDVGYPGIALFNKKQMLSFDDQMMIAKVYISAFLEATMLDKYGYLDLFRDQRTGKKWLPETVYLNQYEDSESDFVCSFEEDLDLSTITAEGGSAGMENLTVWKESMVPLKWEEQDTRAVYAGWNMEEKDSLLAWYAVAGPDGGYLNTSSRSHLIFTMAESTESSNPNPDKEEEEEAEEENGDKMNKEKEKNAGKEKDNEDEKGEKEEDEKEPIDMTIQVKDTSDYTARLPLSHYSYLQPQLEAKLMKADFMTDIAKSEIVFQTFFFPLKDFVEENPMLDPS